ncbi:response regulator [Flagellimonas lutimaris]|uniref:histidine kinase n=1 Tax=Flagellimonas lutimaris TaxID=475082 RepID=A0A3A1NAD2_9FLAO|nr:helix-turn-helix domain-containing protein [Allomuricauda lutimaris]RIV34925.1 response regulator [Allomuricauda lutimaris]
MTSNLKRKVLVLFFVLICGFTLFGQVSQETTVSYEAYRNATKAIVTSFLFIGSFLVMGVYMFLLFIQNRKRDYLLYGIYLLVFTFYFLLRIDEVVRFDILDSSYELHNHLLIPLLLIMTAIYVRFINVFAEIRKYSVPFAKRLDVFSTVFVIVGLGLIVYTLFTHDFEGVRNIKSYLTLPMHAYTLAALIKAFFIIKSRIRHYILWSNIFLFTFSIIGVYSASSLTYDETLTTHVLYGFYTFNSSQLGVFLEMICFALGLGYKFNLIEKEKDDVKGKYIRQLKKNEEVSRQLNEELTHLVEERTSDLKIKNELLEKEREIKANFFANVSHEFRTPITLILGPVQRLLKRKDLSVEDRNAFNMIKLNSNRLLSLVDQLLGISKIESSNNQPEKSKIDLHVFYSKTIGAFQLAMEEKKIELHTQIPKKRTEIIFDEDALSKIVSNLLSNALKYTPERKKVDFFSVLKHNILEITITNTGVGIPEGQKEKIFDRFYQINQNQGTGIGIGLALVNELVNFYKGSITLESKVGEWTTFKVKLPVETGDDKENLKEEKGFLNNLTAIAPPIKEQTPIAQEAPKTHSNLLLVIDDNKDMITFLTSLLSEYFEVISAENGMEGIRTAKERVPDLIISDVMMPIKDGIQLSKELKEDMRTSHIPIILLTARADHKNQLKGIRSGAEEYLVKPFNNELLLAKIESLLSNRNLLQKYYLKNDINQFLENTFNTTEKGFLRQLKEVVEEELENGDFTAEQFAEHLGMSRMQFHRKIKAVSGMSSMEYLNRARLSRAKKMLKNSTLRISEIAFSTGFNDANYFSKVFKKHYKLSPTQFRKQKD